MTNIPAYFSLLKHNPFNITTLQQLRDFTRAHPLEDYPNHDTNIFDGAIEQGFNNSSPEWWEHYTRARYLSGPLGVTGATKNYSLDAIVTPTEHGSIMHALLGLPGINVPLGVYPSDAEVEYAEPKRKLIHVAPGLPYGITFLGGAFEETKLIGMAYAFEQSQKSKARAKPIVRPRTELEDVIERK